MSKRTDIDRTMNGQNEKEMLLQEEEGEEFPGETYTINECMEQIGFGWFQIKLTVILGCGWMADAIAITSLAVLGPALQCYWNLSPEQTAFISTCTFIGMFFGGWFWGWFCDSFGRKLTLTISMASIVLTFLCTSFSPNYNVVLLFMIAQGFMVSGAGQSMTLFFELLPAKKRGVGIVLFGVFFVLGNVVSALSAFLTMDLYGWRIFMMITCLPILVLVLLLWWLPESPRYLLSLGKKDEAMTVLFRIAHDNGTQMPPGELKVIPCYLRKPRGRVTDLLKIEHRKTTILLWFIWFTGIFCYYGVLLCTTLLLNQESSSCSDHHAIETMKTVGIKRDSAKNFILEQLHTLTNSTTSVTNNTSPLSYCHKMKSRDYLGFLLTALGEVPGVLLCFGLADQIGRKRTISLLFFVSVLAMSALHICMQGYHLVGALFILRAFVTGVVQTVYLYTPEVYPTNIRAIGFGTASSMARIGAIMTPFVSQVLLEEHPHYAIFSYSILMTFCIFAALFLPTETKGMNLKDSDEDDG